MSEQHARPLRILAYKPRPARQTIAMESVVCCEPLELEYLAAYLAEHELTLLDGMIDRRDVVAVAAQVQAQVVLFSAFITNVEDVLAWAARLKKLTGELGYDTSKIQRVPQRPQS